MEGEENASKRICTYSIEASLLPVSTSASTSVSGSAVDSATGSADFLHPLQNPLILDTIFAHCSFRELSWCRLVCKAWFEASVSKWRSSAALTVCQYGLRNAYVGNPNKTQWFIPLEMFLDNAEGNLIQLKERPFRGLILQNIQFPLESLTNHLSGFGGYITSLEIRECTFRTVDGLRDLIYSSHLPNLQKLIIFGAIRELGLGDLEVAELAYAPPTYGEHVRLSSLSVKLDWAGDRPPIPWLELLSHFPRLDLLSVSGGDIKAPVLINLLLAIKAVRQHDQNSLQLRTIDVDAFILQDGTVENFRNICALLRELQISLTSLKLKVGKLRRRNGGIAILNELLEVNRQSLQVLQIMTKHNQPAHAFQLPSGLDLEKLTELEINHLLCSNVEFLKVTPNLRELRIRNAFEQNVLQFNQLTNMVSGSRREVMDGLRLIHLRLLKVELFISTKDIRRLTKWMPKVQILSICLNDRQFAIICKQYWRNLKKLEVFGRQLTDHGITGVGVHWRGHISSDEEDDDLSNPDGNLLPNITWLKELQYFHCGSRHLTNASVYNGFLKMAKLEHVGFDCDLQSLEFGDEAKKALRINNVSLSAEFPAVREPEIY